MAGALNFLRDRPPMTGFSVDGRGSLMYYDYMLFIIDLNI